MPDDEEITQDPPSAPPGTGLPVAELLAQFLPIVIDSNTRSAEAATAAAAAISTGNQRLEALERALNENTSAIQQLVGIQDTTAEARRDRLMFVRETVRAIATPQNIGMILVILGAAIGIRLSQPDVLQAAGIVQRSSGTMTPAPSAEGR